MICGTGKHTAKPKCSSRSRTHTIEQRAINMHMYQIRVYRSEWINDTREEKTKSITTTRLWKSTNAIHPNTNHTTTKTKHTKSKWMHFFCFKKRDNPAHMQCKVIRGNRSRSKIHLDSFEFTHTILHEVCDVRTWVCEYAIHCCTQFIRVIGIGTVAVAVVIARNFLSVFCFCSFICYSVVAAISYCHF